ncbi:hypothetical protein [Sphingomonas sp. PB4P5]|uniref:hypothetical protein n=1 Tax=Parasphingomonas puruogangriensis TaxID=3096155 RepID=UPI002FC959BA
MTVQQGNVRITPGANYAPYGYNVAFYKYERLVKAVLAPGTDIPALSIPKKARMSGVVLGGTPVDGSLSRRYVAGGNYQATGLIPQAGAGTIMAIMATTAANTAATTATWLGNSSGATPMAGLNAAGEIQLTMSRAVSPGLTTSISASMLVGGSVRTIAATLTGNQDLPIAVAVATDTSVSVFTGTLATDGTLNVTTAPVTVTGAASAIVAGQQVSGSLSTAYVPDNRTIMPFNTNGTTGTGGTGTYMLSGTAPLAIGSTTFNAGAGPGRRLTLFGAGGKTATQIGAISTAPTARELYVGVQPGVTGINEVVTYSTAAWDYAMTAAEVQAAYQWQQQFYAADGLTI